jgi:uncharacterized protein (TIGR00297 family)
MEKHFLLIGVCDVYVYAVCIGIVLIAFYVSSSKLTRFRQNIKLKLDENCKIGGQRSARQVFACSLVGSILALFYWIQFPEQIEKDEINFIKAPEKSFLIACFIGHYACCTADTWASELGVLSTSDPFLLTTFQRVPPGTNGAISILGTIASIAGGFFIGIVYYLSSLLLFHTQQVQVIWLGGLMGFFGSFLDSFLGATVQSTWYNPKTKKICKEQETIHHQQMVHLCGQNLLTNEQVNAISVLVTTFLSGYVAQYIV